MLVYSLIVDLNRSLDTYLGYSYFLTIVVLCAQSYGHISGIIFTVHQNVTLLFAISLALLSFVLSNSLIPLKELHPIMQYLSHMSCMKPSFESMIILNYGFDKCPHNQISLVLHRFGIESSDFWFNCILLLFDLIILKIITLILLIVKINGIFLGFGEKVGTNNEPESNFKTDRNVIFNRYIAKDII